ncbi:phage tail assembly chaperone G [Bacillus altitudinis]|uniref:phage tail assembly chaperone G n=1 Tax=Bacillus altitudinis TaxID=293387 RepID=UPI003B004DD3
MKLTMIDAQTKEEKTYTKDMPSARQLRRALELEAQAEQENMEATAMLDEMITYVVDVFGQQFSYDDFLDNVPSDETFQTIADVIMQVTGQKKGNGLKKKAVKAQK